jgi:hypothetical protein
MQILCTPQLRRLCSHDANWIATARLPRTVRTLGALFSQISWALLAAPVPHRQVVEQDWEY